MNLEGFLSYGTTLKFPSNNSNSNLYGVLLWRLLSSETTVRAKYGERREKREKVVDFSQNRKNQKPKTYLYTNDPRTAAALAVTVDFLCQSKIKCQVLQKTLWMELVIIAE